MYVWACVPGHVFEGVVCMRWVYVRVHTQVSVIRRVQWNRGRGQLLGVGLRYWGRGLHTSHP